MHFHCVNHADHDLVCCVLFSIIIMHLSTLWSHQSMQGNIVKMMMTCPEESLKERLLSVAKIFFPRHEHGIKQFSIPQ